MKKKGFIFVLSAIVIISSLVACTQKPNVEKVTQAVTDENGELVTNKDGELVTEELEAEVVTDEKGNTVTEVVTDKEGKPVTTVINDEYVNVTQAVTSPANKPSDSSTKKDDTTKKPDKSTEKDDKDSKDKDDKDKDDKDSKDKDEKDKDDKDKEETTTKAPIKKPEAPAKPAKLSVSDIKENSVKLTWSKVKCKGYQVQYSQDGTNYEYLKKSTTATSLTVDGLESYTKYYFRVRAYNKNNAGTSVSKWAKATATTDADESSRYITIEFLLSAKGNLEDTLIIKIGNDKYEEKVNLDGKPFTFKTPKQYKGIVKIEASLKDTGSAAQVKTDKDFITIDLTSGIYTFEGEDD